jgi:3-hydroxyanthranilate 3,4-dioxygenase
MAVDWPAPFDLMEWLAENRQYMKPPVTNRLFFENKDGMVLQMLGGGNQRVDFHDDPAEEFFYQMKGDMLLKVHVDGEIRDIPIREGEVFLLPAHVPHSPQRPDPDSVGMVIEGRRLPGDLDAFQWYCFNCGEMIDRVELPLKSIVEDLPPLFAAFYADMERRTCKSCGTVHPGKEPPAGWVKL